jgi:outer membrane protein assembly factor BamB
VNRRQYLRRAGAVSILSLAGCSSLAEEGQREPGTVACAEGVPRTGDALPTGEEDWPTVQYDAQRRGYVPGRLGPQGCPSVRWRWKHDDDIVGPGMHTSALVVDETVYIADESPPPEEGGNDANTLVAIDAVTGRERWRFEGVATPEETPTIAAGVIYVPSRYGIQAIDITERELLWYATFGEGQKNPGGSESAEVPAVVDDSVYAGTFLGELYAFDAVTGAVEWTFAARGLPSNKVLSEEPDAVAETRRAGVFDGPVAVADGVVYAANWDSHLYAIDATTGEELWSKFLYSPESWTTRPSPPAVYDGTVYTSTRYSGGVLALDAKTGEREWVFDQLPYGEGVAPAVTDSSVYASVGTSSENMYLVSLDRETGDLNWKTWIGLPDRGPIVDDHAVYIDQGYVMLACDRRTGSELWWFRKYAGSFASPSLANGAIYMADTRGNVYGLW